MASNLRVDNIQPSTGMGIGIGTANGSVTFNADVTGGLNVTNGSVGIGTDNPNAAKLDVRGSNNPLLKLTQTTSGIARLNIESETNDGYQYAGIGIGTASADAELMWTTLGFDVNVADSVRLRIPSSGDVQVLTGNLVIGTSGKGIDFSAATGFAAGSTSAVLNDYEEGTWTPYWSDYSGTNLFVNNDINIVHATYTKINKMIIYSTYFTSDASFSYNTAGGISGGTAANIGGLPFTSNGYHAGAVGYFTNWTGYDSSGYGFTPMIISNDSTSTLRLQYPSTNGGANLGASSLLNANSAIIVSGVYYTT